VQIGQFQSYDRRAMASLSRAADDAGRPEWGRGPPPGTGHYNSQPQDTPFFTWNGGWQTPQGDFFLSWYSGALTEHAERLLQAAVRVFYPFMGAAAQADIQERSHVPVAGLPTDPPVRRNSSDAALDTSVASLPERRSCTALPRFTQQSDGAHVAEHDSEAGPTFAHAAPPVSTSATSLSTEASGVTLKSRNGPCLPEDTAHGHPTCLVNGRVHCMPSPPLSEPAAPSCTAGSSASSSRRGKNHWDDARTDLEGGGRKQLHCIRSVCSSASLASSPTDTSQRVPLRVSMKLAGAGFMP
jgi:Glycosyl hydrolase family 14